MTSSEKIEESTIADLKEDTAKAKKEFSVLYDLIPEAQRYRVGLEMDELNTRLKKFANSKQYYRSDGEAFKKSEKSVKQVFGLGFILLLVWGVGHEWLEFVETGPTEASWAWILFGGCGLAAYIDQQICRQSLMFSARQLVDDKARFNAISVLATSENISAALQYQNEFLEGERYKFSHDELEWRRNVFWAEFRAVTAQNILTSLGINWLKHL